MKYILVLNLFRFAFDLATTGAFQEILRGRYLAPKNSATLFSRVLITNKREDPRLCRYSCSTDQYTLEDDDCITGKEDASQDDDAEFRDEIEVENFFREVERDANRMNLPKGKPEGYFVTDMYYVPKNGFENLMTEAVDNSSKGITLGEIERLGISETNITLPIALMLLDKDVYPSLSKARKSCR